MQLVIFLEIDLCQWIINEFLRSKLRHVGYVVSWPSENFHILQIFLTNFGLRHCLSEKIVILNNQTSTKSSGFLLRTVLYE